MKETTTMYIIGTLTGMMLTPILKNMFNNIKEIIKIESEKK